MDAKKVIKERRNKVGKTNEIKAYTDIIDMAKEVVGHAYNPFKQNFNKIDKLVEELIDNTDDKMTFMGEIKRLGEKDSYLLQHSLGVSMLCIVTGKWMGLKAEYLHQLGLAGMVHDIGKIYIDEKILLKPDKLTTEEFDIVKRHVMYGYLICSSELRLDSEVCKAVLEHHERLDGSGYLKYKEGEINWMAEIIAVADSIDAMSTERVYSSKKPYKTVMKEIMSGARNNKYNKEVVELMRTKIKGTE